MRVEVDRRDCVEVAFDALSCFENGSPLGGLEIFGFVSRSFQTHLRIVPFRTPEVRLIVVCHTLDRGVKILHNPLSLLRNIVVAVCGLRRRYRGRRCGHDGRPLVVAIFLGNSIGKSVPF